MLVFTIGAFIFLIGGAGFINQWRGEGDVKFTSPLANGDRPLPDLTPDLTQDRKIVFAVKNRSPAALDALLTTISDPYSPTYGHYLTLSDLGRMTYNEEAFMAVLDFLLSKGMYDIHHTVNRDFVIVNAPLFEIESLLKTKFVAIESAGSAVISASTYSLPSRIAHHVDFVGGLSHVPFHRARRLRQAPAGDPDLGPIIKGFVTPQLINDVYAIDNNRVWAGSNASLFEAIGQCYSREDLGKFQNIFHLPREDVDQIIGPNVDETCATDPSSCGEANLDVQYLMAVAQQADTSYWSIDAADPDPFLSFVVMLADDEAPPLIHSISYGGPETMEVTADRFNQELIKLGLRGLTVVVSSGDDGANSPQVRSDPLSCGPSPSFPASSPYVVTVGATQGPESGRDEVACSSSTGGIISSGGGFSSMFARPSYQRQAVDHFLAKSDPNELGELSLSATNGRAYPDVALMGYNFLLVDDMTVLQESGTSASAPVFAGMLTLINDALLRDGRPPLGFVNPLLYALAAQTTTAGAFNDIVTGNNRCAASIDEFDVNCCRFGFNATEGWDPVTGLGSVNFVALKSAVLEEEVQLQDPSPLPFDDSTVVVVVNEKGREGYLV